MAVGDTLKRDIGLGVLAVVVMLGLLGWSFWRLENGTDRLRDTELRFEAAAQDLLATIGFDGMIHDFKNCVLRPDEPRYCAETEENAALATSQLDTLSGLAAEAGLGLEVEAVRDAALAYGAAADTVRQLHAQGLPIAEIDARVRYDDVPASRQIYATLTLTRDAMNDRIAEVVRSLRIQSLAATAALLLVLGGFGILLRRDYFLSVERERRFAAVFSALSGGLAGMDGQGRIVLANPAARAILQLPDSVPPFSWPGHLRLSPPGDDGEGFSIGQLLDEVQTGEQMKGRILLLRDTTRPDNDLYIRLSSAALDKQLGELSAILVIDDVTDQERNRQQIERNSRLDALAQLTGGVAHDFNNLLATILYAVDIARKDTEPGRAQEMLTRAHNAVSRGRDLTSRLLTFARRNPGSSQSRPVAEVLKDLEQLARPAVEENVELVFELSEPDLRVFCDPAQLDTALLNLVLNSRDAIRSSGTGSWIRIKARSVTTSSPGLLHRQVYAHEPGDRDLRFVEITVTDNGPGMTPEVRRRATDPYFSTKSDSDSAGLGLAMVYGFVRQSNGDMRMYSDVGRGTTVCLTLPRGNEADQREQPQSRPSVPQGAGERVLLVEDEPDLLFAMSQMLTDMGYRVIPASQATEAVRLIDEGTDFDILLSDVVMPGGIDGIELASRVRKSVPDSGILLMSGYISLSVEAQEQYTFPVLQKPCMPEELAAALREVRPRQTRGPADQGR
ncbi:response regulator [Marinibacterium profundimaris]|uniref:response regulator n=1 Tax=Marinibacterium profundimaris TaxID=1679460 RepID=UPI000B521C7A|nr:response regulator [Marinibacterium profundimaris]